MANILVGKVDSEYLGSERSNSYREHHIEGVRGIHKNVCDFKSPFLKAGFRLLVEFLNKGHNAS
jgi:hypothetical protein